MFSIHCPRHGQDVLLGHRQILGIDGRGHDMAVRYRCWCGHEGTHRPQARHPGTSTMAPAAAAAAA
jgi:hypothetical protein